MDTPIDPASLSDHDLVKAYGECTTGEPGNRDAYALLAEIRRRELDV